MGGTEGAEETLEKFHYSRVNGYTMPKELRKKTGRAGKTPPLMSGFTHKFEMHLHADYNMAVFFYGV